MTLNLKKKRNQDEQVWLEFCLLLVEKILSRFLYTATVTVTPMLKSAKQLYSLF